MCCTVAETIVTFMPDREVVAAIVTGDPRGIAAAYDRAVTVVLSILL